MTSDIEKFIRIQKRGPSAKRAAADWRTLPNADRVRVWEMSTFEPAPDDIERATKGKRFIFHIGFVDGVVRGCRVSYLGEYFIILEVSDSTRLLGLELRCVPQSMFTDA